MSESLQKRLEFGRSYLVREHRWKRCGGVALSLMKVPLLLSTSASAFFTKWDVRKLSRWGKKKRPNVCQHVQPHFLLLFTLIFEIVSYMNGTDCCSPVWGCCVLDWIVFNFTNLGDYSNRFENLH